jgi:hypothetical protein
MVWIHVAAGLLALVAGAVALYAPKGRALHRRSGRVFAGAMLLMTTSAVVLAAFLRPNPGNVIAGTLTCYLVLTGVLAVLRTRRPPRAAVFGLMLVALAVGLAATALGLEARSRPGGAIDGIPAAVFFMFATVGTVAGLLDARLLIAGGLDARPRLARHLWRMGYAMWIATLSFFLGQADVFPQAVRASGVLALPVLLVTATVLYWVVRVALLGRLPGPPRPLPARDGAPRRQRPAAPALRGDAA